MQQHLTVRDWLGGVCFFGLILVPFNGGDEPRALRYATCSDCPMGADLGQYGQNKLQSLFTIKYHDVVKKL